MAGTYFEIQRPGYSTLTTHDVPYMNGTGETGVNVFSPISDRPLIEGEWLQWATGVDGWRAMRGGDNVVTVPGTPDNEGEVLAFPHWLEQGRFDAQTRQYSHLLKGPVGFTFRTRVCDTTFGALEVGDAVSVWDLDCLGSVVRRGLAKRGSGLGVGWVERIYGLNDIAVYFHPGAV